MKHTIYKIIGATFVTAAIITGCAKKLDLIPETQVADENFWKSTNDLMSACNDMYGSLPVITNNVNAVWTDDGYAQAPNTVSDGSRTVPVTDNAFTIPYALIRKANNILEKSVRVSGDPALIRRYKAEAYFFRAFAYSELVKRYGAVPLILRTFDVNDTLTVAHRTAREVVLDSLYKDLDSATAGLPWASALAAAEYGRITKNAALAMKSRVGLFEGTRNKYHSLGDASKHLNLALTATETLMTGGGHSLYRYTAVPDSSYFYLFQYAGNGPANKENILARIYGQNATNSISEHNYTRQALDAGLVTATRSIMDAYVYKDGLPLGKSPLEKPQTTTLSEFTDRDPRIGMTIFSKVVPGFSLTAYVPTWAFAPTGYKVRKYATVQDWASQQSFNHHIIIRYGEILLNYAELKWELGGGAISDADLDKSINLIRTRAGIPALTNAFVTTNGLNMQEEMRRERRVELAFEGEFRYWDLIRWKTAEIELPKTVKGSKKFPAEQVNVPNSAVDANGFVIVQDASKRTFDTKRDYWWPFPSRETGLNTNMGQNLNW
jgi:hypothetical protein